MATFLFITNFVGVIISWVIVTEHKTWRELCLGASLLLVFTYIFAGEISDFANIDKLNHLFVNPIRPLILRPLLVIGALLAVMDKFVHDKTI